MKEKAVYLTVRRTRFGRVYGPVVRHSAESTLEKISVLQTALRLGTGLVMNNKTVKGSVSGLIESGSVTVVHSTAIFGHSVCLTGCFQINTNT